jgi:hypothetical protein
MSTPIIKPSVQKLIARIKAINFDSFIYDKPRIEAAFREHFKRLNLEMLPIQWFDSFDAAWSAAGSAAWSAARSAARSAAESRPESAAESAAWSAAWSAARSAAGSAAWSAARLNCESKEAKKYGGIWLPFQDASEAGLWLYWITEKAILVVPRPVVKLQENRLHSDNSPAVHWPNGKSWWYLYGVQVEQWMAETQAEQLDITKVLKVSNNEQRTAVMRRIGVDRLIQKIGAKSLDTWGDYTLLEIKLNDRVCRYLKMLNPSVGIWHVEGVPVDCKTVEDALHSRKPNVLKSLPIDETNGSDWFQQGDVCIWPKNAISVKRYPEVLT